MRVRADDYAQRFLTGWREHYVAEAVRAGDPADVDLPVDWQASLDRLCSAGLGVAAMLEAITITMDREDVAAAGLFSYFCGVCWTTLRADEGVSPRQHRAGKAQLPILPRSVVRTVACPYCGALAGECCIGSRGKPRETNHLERVLTAEAAASPPS